MWFVFFFFFSSSLSCCCWPWIHQQLPHLANIDVCPENIQSSWNTNRRDSMWSYIPMQNWVQENAFYDTNIGWCSATPPPFSTWLLFSFAILMSVGVLLLEFLFSFPVIFKSLTGYEPRMCTRSLDGVKDGSWCYKPETHHIKWLYWVRFLLVAF